MPAVLLRALRGWPIRSLRIDPRSEPLHLDERNEILASLPYLEELHENYLDGLDRETLARMRLIRTSGCGFLKGVSLPRMTEMEIWFPTMPSFEGFDMPQIKVLDLRGPSQGPLSTRGLEPYQLRHLFVQSQRQFSDLSGIRRCGFLELDSCRGLDFDTLVDGVSISNLTARGCGRIPSVRGLSRVRDLEGINFCGSTTVEDGDLSPLCAIPDVYIEGRKHYSHRMNRSGGLVPRT